MTACSTDVLQTCFSSDVSLEHLPPPPFFTPVFAKRVHAMCKTYQAILYSIWPRYLLDYALARFSPLVQTVKCCQADSISLTGSHKHVGL